MNLETSYGSSSLGIIIAISNTLPIIVPPLILELPVEHTIEHTYRCRRLLGVWLVPSTGHVSFFKNNIMVIATDAP